MSDIDQAAVTAQFQFCNQCGDKLGLDTRFCGKCGTAVDAGTALLTASTGNGAVLGASMEQEPQSGLTLMQGWGCYAGAIAVLAIVLKFALVFTFIVYVISGVFMSRFVMRRLIEWHPNFNTLHNVASAKLAMVAFWPFSMLSLLFKLSANHVL